MGSPESAKKRILPTWMTGKVAEPAQGVAEVRPKRRKKTVLARTETMYCMNEAELVDVALCILAENCAGKQEEITSSEDESHGPQPGHADPVSVSSTSNNSRVPIPETEFKPPHELEALGCSEVTTLEEKEDEDDALKYVREIFFS